MTTEHGVMYQAFEWNQPDDGSTYRDLAARAEQLQAQGFTAVWFPPPGKGQSGPADVGYGVYDPYDLGEFDQKGAVRTKYGTKDELLAAIDAVQRHGMDAYLDIVMGHRIGGDETEVVEVDPAYRLNALGEPYTIQAWSRYQCPGRAGAYSDFVWTHEHFNAFGYDHNQPDAQGKIFRRADREFSAEVDGEYGNFEYLMGANVDHSREDVRDELVRWGTWLLQTTSARGVRLDAVKHISRSFMAHWLTRCARQAPSARCSRSVNTGAGRSTRCKATSRGRQARCACSTCRSTSRCTKLGSADASSICVRSCTTRWCGAIRSRR